MNALTEAALFAALRYRLARYAPARIEAGTHAWADWRERASACLPRPAAPRVLIVASIQCSDDIILHASLLQLLSRPSIQAAVLFALPNRQAISVLLGQARREGWASLVSFETPARIRTLLGQLPQDTVVAVLPSPMPLTDEALAEIERRLAGPRAESPQADPYFLSNQAFIGSALSWQAQEPSWHFSFDSVTFDGLFKAFDDQEGSPAPFSQTPYAGWDDDTLQRSPTNKVRVFSDSVEMPAVPSGALVAVTVRSEGGATRVTAIQPSFLAPPEGLSLPVLPRYASETSRQMQIHLIGDDEVKASQEFHFNVPPSHIEPWMLSAYLNRGGGGNPVIRAFAAGTGCRLAYAEDEPETLSDIPVVWGVLRDSDRILAQAQAQGLHFFYIDHAYFDRGHGKSYRITRNRFEAGKVRKVGADRLQRLDLDIQPWRKSGKAIIVCPPTDYFMAAHGCADWLETTLAKLHLETDRPIIVREKPQPGQPTVPLAKALRHAHALVTHSSNVAIEAACLGTPVFVSPTSAAAPIGQTDVGLIESPVYPDRDEWLCHLAYSQYAMEEIRDGTAWHILKHLEACDFV